MTARMIAALCVVAMWTVPAWTQAEKSEEGTAGQYVGVITGTNVYVRGGPGTTAYPCTKLSTPAQITVVGKTPGWLKIAAPPDCFSAISKDLVKVDETLKTGTVIGDNVFARAGGTLRTSQFNLIQVRLMNGDKVQILGEADGYYKIVPPPGAYFWISDQYVKSLTAAAAPEETATKPAEEAAAPRPPAAPGNVARPPAPPPAEAEDAALAAFRAAEKDLVAEMRKPYTQRDLQGLIAKYQAINIGGSEFLAHWIPARVKFLQSALQLTNELKEVEASVKDTADKQKEYEEQLVKVQVAAPETQPVTRYAARGVIFPSEVFPGGAAAPKRYIVRDPQTLRIDAYVQCTTDAVKLERYEGKCVGIFGKTTYEAALALDVVEAEKVVVLDENISLPLPPQPIVKPLPKPEPKPKPAPPPEAPKAAEPATKPAKPLTKPAPPPVPPPTEAEKLEMELLGPPPAPAAKPAPPTTKPAEAATTRPAAPTTNPAAPTTNPAAPTTRPAAPAKPLPPTGLPMIEPKTQPTAESIDEKEFK